MVVLDPPLVTADAIDAAKTYLRIEQDEEDALIASLLCAALAHVEAFINQIVLTRAGAAILPASWAWQRIGAAPVRAITQVQALAIDGTKTGLPVESFSIDIDSRSDGWVRLLTAQGTNRIEVGFVAGIAEDWDRVPEPLRLAILRLTSHLHAYRDTLADQGPPAAIPALLQPWRRLRIA